MIDTISIRGAYRGKTFPETTIQILCDEIDRMRGEKQTPPQGETVRVPVWEEKWGMTHSTQYFVMLPVPAEVEVVARVEGE